MAFPVDQVVTNAGQINNAGDARALYLKVFAGEVLTAWHQDNMALGMTRVRTISNGL